MNFYTNHSVVQTSVPQNEAELQLYRVMQRASLLSYYDTLLEMGKVFLLTHFNIRLQHLHDF